MDPKAAYESTQVGAFAALVEDGTYSENFDHAPRAQEFFNGVMSQVMNELADTRQLRVLDCGCGNGAWLDFLVNTVSPGAGETVFGYDLTPEMVDVARRRLSVSVPPENFQVGNILESESYCFDGSGGLYELIITYDVVQQLPRKLQFEACNSILQHLRPGGTAVIFDNDCKSAFGRRMGRRKFFTRYFGMKLVPQYYCNAHYPPLAKFAEQIAKKTNYTTEVLVSGNGMKRALIIRYRSSAAG